MRTAIFTLGLLGVSFFSNATKELSTANTAFLAFLCVLSEILCVAQDIKELLNPPNKE